jgi:hypothetical protein
MEQITHLYRAYFHLCLNPVCTLPGELFLLQAFSDLKMLINDLKGLFLRFFRVKRADKSRFAKKKP